MIPYRIQSIDGEGSLKDVENRKLIVLDRDGVINQDSDVHIRSPEQWVAIPGSLEAIARLCRQDYQIVIVTNQSGISRGYYSVNTLNRIHQKMLDELSHFGGEISALFFCPHSDKHGCECRKPKPGMLLELAQRLKCNLNGVYAVGDSLRDLQAAQSAGARPVLVETGKGLSTLKKLESSEWQEKFGRVPRFNDLASFVDHILTPISA